MGVTTVKLIMQHLVTDNSNNFTLYARINNGFGKQQERIMYQ
ncbi:unnamed protein product [Tenebrio molitor]|nr:unnamed protein product [Tenebrio molitor]